MATTERPYKPLPFLNWKGMRRWSAGRRAPKVCKLFTETKSSSSFTSKLASLATMAKLLRQATSSFLSPSSPSSSSPPPFSVRASSAATRAASASLHTETLSAAQARVPMQRCTSYSSNNSMRVGAMAIANCLRRHSDAIAPPAARVTVPLSRFSIDSAHPYYSTSHLNNNEENAVRPKIARLGSGSHDKANLISTGSPMVAKMKDTCAHFVHTAARQSSTRHPLDLIVNNPFLTRLNPAPVSSVLLHSTNHVSTPSSGLLNVSKARDLQLNDRIVFFV